MYPILFSIGALTIYSYGFFLALAYLLATFVFWREGKRQGYQEEKLIDFSVACLVAAIVGGRILYTLLNLELFTSDPKRILFFWEGGFAYYGSLLAVLVVGTYLIRKWRWSFFQLADFGSLAVLVAFVVGKTGSFLSGNDFGSLTELPWGTNFEYLEGTRHPVQLYEGLIASVLLIVLYRYYKKNISRLGQLRSGAVFFYFLIFSSLSRLIFENFRGDSTFLGPIRFASLASLSVALLATLALYFYQFRNFSADVKSVSKYVFGVKIKFRNPLAKGR
jgi:phosphatidylglycerol:prolipoprotein diacylglycerol transferase